MSGAFGRFRVNRIWTATNCTKDMTLDYKNILDYDRTVMSVKNYVTDPESIDICIEAIEKKVIKESSMLFNFIESKNKNRIEESDFDAIAEFLRVEYPVLEALDCSEYILEGKIDDKTLYCLKKLYLGEYPGFSTNTVSYNEMMKKKRHARVNK